MYGTVKDTPTVLDMYGTVKDTHSSTDFGMYKKYKYGTRRIHIQSSTYIKNTNIVKDTIIKDILLFYSKI